jgi:hypothetical protein
VQLNADGVEPPVYRAGMFDVDQIEVLKAPQALFHGRRSSAGNSADLTDKWTSEVTTRYEFNAQETGLDGFVFGPITDNLGIRIAGGESPSCNSATIKLQSVERSQQIVSA